MFENENHGLQTCDVWRQNVEDLAWVIENKFSDYLLPPPKGIYSIAHLEPVMVDGGIYFIRQLQADGSTVVRQIHDLTDVKGSAVFTIKGSVKDYLNKQKVEFGSLMKFANDGYNERVVIPKMFVEAKDRYLSTTPFMPYRGVEIIKGLINEQLNMTAKYPRQPEQDSNWLYRQFLGWEEACATDGLSKKEIDANLANFCELIDPMHNEIVKLYDPIHDEIAKFIRGYEWHIYFMSMTATRITIEKSIDWRAWLWIQEQEKKELERLAGEH